MSKFNILVTGGAGFIGSNLVEKLLELGHSVRILDNFSNGKRENIKPFLSDIQLFEGSITDPLLCKKACEGVNLVSHQAAYGSVPRSLKDPSLYSHNNLHGFVVLAQAAREAGVERLAYASSSSVYGTQADSPKVEERIGTPLSPYAASKLANEIFAHSFSNAFGLTCIGLRYFNVYGPKQDPFGAYAAVVPLFFSHLLRQSSPLIYGDGEQSRDFTYVENVVQANIQALTAPGLSGSKVYNIGCGETTTVNMLFKGIAGLLGSTLSPSYQEPRAGDVRNSLANISKAQLELGYDPKIKLAEGLAKTYPHFASLFAN